MWEISIQTEETHFVGKFAIQIIEILWKIRKIAKFGWF